MAHRTVAREAAHEEVVQGSRFIASVAEADSPTDAERHVEAARAAHPEATHHCWAYRIGTAQRFADDGEPGGTAGRPMLEVILKRRLDHVSAVVVRYFGGKKLGAGGLARAYSGSLAKALDAAGVRQVVDVARLTVRAPFASADVVLRSLDAFAKTHQPFSREAPEFDGRGMVLGVTLPVEAAAELRRALGEATRGSARVEPDDLAVRGG